MKWILIVLALFILIGFIAYIALAIQSHKKPGALGLQQGMLRSCPDLPNCVCSESHSQSSEQHALAPIKAEPETWNRLTAVIVKLGGLIQYNDGHYLHATFTTPVFRYVDDVELRFDQALDLIHIRSASRVGRSDFSVNRNRVESMKQALKTFQVQSAAN